VGHQPGALHVQPDDRAEALRRDVLGGRHVLAARVVHEQVDPPVALQNGLDERIHLVLLADVACARLDAPALGCASGLLERLLPPSAHHDPRTERGQLERGRTPETRAAAADHGNLPVEQPGLEDLRRHRAAA
jgi:hypothetical protein